MDKDIKEHIDQCEPCQTTTDKGKPPDGPITGLQITSGPSQRIHADLFGPLQNSERRNMYILVITDAFTKMARLTPLIGKDVATVKKSYDGRHVLIWGPTHRRHGSKTRI
jgi:hypothetical protein